MGPAFWNPTCRWTSAAFERLCSSCVVGRFEGGSGGCRRRTTTRHDTSRFYDGVWCVCQELMMSRRVKGAPAGRAEQSAVASVSAETERR